MDHVTWPAALAARVADEAARAYPEECCGLLLGHEGNPTALAMIANAAEDGRREVSYLLSPGAYRRAEAQARDEGLQVVGVVHSHPDHPAEPSPTDLAEAWPEWLYVIVPVIEGTPGVPRAWRLRADRSAFDAVTLIHSA